MTEVTRLLDETPLLLTAELWPPTVHVAKSLAVSRLVLERGLDPNVSAAPRRALDLACYHALPDIAELLLAHGATATELNALGETPFDLLDAYEPKPIGEHDANPRRVASRWRDRRHPLGRPRWRHAATLAAPIYRGPIRAIGRANDNGKTPFDYARRGVAADRRNACGDPLATSSMNCWTAGEWVADETDDGRGSPGGRSAAWSFVQRAPPMKAAPRRTAIVFLSLVGVLSATSALLLALSPAPLRPEAAASLLNAETPSTDGFDAVFQTDRPIRTGRWTSIRVHQSNTLSGDARTLAHSKTGVGDHFIICNGDGAADGEIQLTTRWTDQRSALPPHGTKSIDPSCISICLIGDFKQATPTIAQERRLMQLVTSLQEHLGLAPDRYAFPGAQRWQNQ